MTSSTVMLKTILLIFVATALSVTLTMRSIDHEQTTKTTTTTTTKKRVSRFLKEEKASSKDDVVNGIPGIGGNNGNGVGGGGIKNPNAADHCNKDAGLCKSLYGEGFECCNNKCINLNNDKQNCGACKSKCKFQYDCCRGQCVMLSLDKRHCGHCGNSCPGAHPECIYGLCNYA